MVRSHSLSRVVVPATLHMSCSVAGTTTLGIEWVRSRRVLHNMNPMPESDTKKFWKSQKKIKKNHGTGCKNFSVAPISVSRSQRGNKQYFNLGLSNTLNVNEILKIYPNHQDEWQFTASMMICLASSSRAARGNPKTCNIQK